MTKTSLVLEGGGMRGAYTAGCLSWLIDEGITFDNHYGISTGALHLCSYLKGDKKDLHELSTKYICDKSSIGFRSLFREGRLVSYDHLFDDSLEKMYGYDFESIKKSEKNAKIGVYDLAEEKTVYISTKNITKDYLKAACSLPIIGKIVNIDNREYLDGGITEMIPISEAINDDNDRFLIIATKPSDYVRKPANKIVVFLMKMLYPNCHRISIDYSIRHLNYQKQIDIINELKNKKQALYFCPSESVKVSRLNGDPKTLSYLYELGRKDMEKRKQEIYALFK